MAVVFFLCCSPRAEGAFHRPFSPRSRVFAFLDPFWPVFSGPFLSLWPVSPFGIFAGPVLFRAWRAPFLPSFVGSGPVVPGVPWRGLFPDGMAGRLGLFFLSFNAGFSGTGLLTPRVPCAGAYLPVFFVFCHSFRISSHSLHVFTHRCFF